MSEGLAFTIFSLQGDKFCREDKPAHCLCGPQKAGETKCFGAPYVVQLLM